jgi:hypothetical protein
VDARNQLLRRFPLADRDALAAHLTPISLASGDILYEPDYAVDWVYFPTT